jgi:hypothetical protein
VTDKLALAREARKESLELRSHKQEASKEELAGGWTLSWLDDLNWTLTKGSTVRYYPDRGAAVRAHGRMTEGRP